MKFKWILEKVASPRIVALWLKLRKTLKDFCRLLIVELLLLSFFGVVELLKPVVELIELGVDFRLVNHFCL